jgi:nucleotide-binding universal stress UspA family protein
MDMAEQMECHPFLAASSTPSTAGPTGATITRSSKIRKGVHMVVASKPHSVASTRAAPARRAMSAGPAPVDVAPLVVGFDGSMPATAALGWAAGTGIPVIVVRVVDPRPRPPGADRPTDELGVDEVALVLGDHADVAGRRLADCAWRPELVEACSPAAGLAASARRHGAAAIVVGSHRRGHGHAVLSNQVHELMANADAPVVVVPPQAAAHFLGSRERKRPSTLA